MDIVDQIVERLRVCWCVLTMRNYFFFAFKSHKKLFVVNEDGVITGSRRENVCGICYVDDVPVKIMGGTAQSEEVQPSSLRLYKNLRDLLCEAVIRLMEKIREGES